MVNNVSNNRIRERERGKGREGRKKFIKLKRLIIHSKNHIRLNKYL